MMSLLCAAALAVTPAAGFAQGDAEEKPEVQKEWVVGYALAFLPMAGAMYFMFRMHKRHDFKVKKEGGETKGH